MIGMTASHLDRFAVDQLKSCASDIVVATSGENTGPTTGGADEGSHDATWPEITMLVNQFLTHVRSLDHAAKVDEEFERVKTCLAGLPREEWVPCENSARHNELGRFEETYSMVTRERRWRGAMAAFEVALATYKCGRDEVEGFMDRAQAEGTEEAKERVEKGKDALAVVRGEVEKYTKEMIVALNDCEFLISMVVRMWGWN